MMKIDRCSHSFLDNYTHYSITFVLKSQAEVSDAFIVLERNANAKFNSKIHMVCVTKPWN